MVLPRSLSAYPHLRIHSWTTPFHKWTKVPLEALALLLFVLMSIALQLEILDCVLCTSSNTFQPFRTNFVVLFCLHLCGVAKPTPPAHLRLYFFLIDTPFHTDLLSAGLSYCWPFAYVILSAWKTIVGQVNFWFFILYIVSCEYHTVEFFKKSSLIVLAF